MKFAVFDIDGTVHRDAMSFIVAEPIIAEFATRQEKSKLAAATRTWKERGSNESYWAYNKKILELFEKVLPRVNATELAATVDEVLRTRGRHTYAYTTQLIKELKADNYKLIAISGSIKDVVEPFALSNGFDIVVASGLEVVDGKLTGKRVAQINKGKSELLHNLVKEHELKLEGSVAVGDTHRDISILAMVERPIAFNPNAALYEEAEKQGWEIVLERKNMVYELRFKNGHYIVNRAHPIYSNEHQEGTQ